MKVNKQQSECQSKAKQPWKSEETRPANLIHQDLFFFFTPSSACFKSFLLILTYSCKLLKAQLSQESRSYPVIVY